MSKSVARVRRALEAAGLDAQIREMPAETRTARQAAEAVGCEIDQIAKSIVFRGERSDAVVLFITAGGNRVDPPLATAAAGEPLLPADAAFVRARTGFVIGGVAPIGHLSPVRAWFDPKLMDFSVVWAAAGTPRHVFPAASTDLLAVSGAQLAEFAVTPHERSRTGPS